MAGKESRAAGKGRRGEIKIDLGELTYAFEGSDLESNYFLNLDTGKLELIIPDVVGGLLEMEEVQEKIDLHPGRYLRVPSIDTRETYQDMVDFTESVADERLQELLSAALRGKGAFRRFKDALSSYPEERERWFSFKDERMTERVKEWLEEIGVDYYYER